MIEKLAHSLVVLFDLDGTLIDSSEDVRHALNVVLPRYGGQLIAAEDIYAFIGEGVERTVLRALDVTNKKLSQEKLSSIIQQYLRQYQSNPIHYTKLYPDVITVLELLQNKNILMGICTNKPSLITGLILQKLNLLRFFKAIVAGGDVPYLKPDGRHIDATIERLDVAKTHTNVVMVGDSQFDVQAARNAHISVVGVRYGYGGAQIDQSKPDVSIARFIELPDVLTSLFPSIRILL